MSEFIHDNDWPVSAVEQRLYIEELKRELAKTKARLKPVVINSDSTPTQKEWENAYITQTGLPLPILVGTRFIHFKSWYKIPRQYTTTLDINGIESSGTVYPIQPDYNQNVGYRLVAKMNLQRTNGVIDIENYIRAIHRPGDYYFNVSEGVTRLRLFVSLKVNSNTVGSISLRYRTEKSFGHGIRRVSHGKSAMLWDTGVPGVYRMEFSPEDPDWIEIPGATAPYDGNADNRMTGIIDIIGATSRTNGALWIKGFLGSQIGGTYDAGENSSLFLKNWFAFKTASTVATEYPSLSLFHIALSSESSEPILSYTEDSNVWIYEELGDPEKAKIDHEI